MDMPSDCESSDPSDAQPEERRESDPRGSMAPSEARAPMDSPFGMHSAFFDVGLQLKRSAVPSQSRAPIFDISSPDWMKTEHWFKPPSLGMVPAVVTPHDTGNALPVSGLATNMAANRLRHSQLVKTDDHVHWEALKKFKTLLLCDPAAAELGRSLVSGVSLLTDEAEWSRSLSDAFAGKAVATLAKKSSALWRFHNWSIENGLGLAMCATESVISRFMQFLKEHGYPTTGSAFLQTWTSLHYQIWLKRRMTTGEAQLFLKEFMASSGFSEEELTRIGCHSLKCTLLSWTSKDAIFQSQTDLLWATICPKENQSAVVYSRDELTRVGVVIYQMTRDVENKHFKPDAPRAERIADQVELTDSESQQADLSNEKPRQEDAESTPCNMCQRAPWDDLPLDELRRLKVHTFSGVAHIASKQDPHRFVCGRRSTKNYGRVPEGSNYADMPICMQCRK